jgi:phage shock protein C
LALDLCEAGEGRARLRRSREHRIVAGVCGGIAEWLGWNPILVRVSFVLVSLVPLVPGLLLYVLLWVLLPRAK